MAGWKQSLMRLRDTAKGLGTRAEPRYLRQAHCDLVEVDIGKFPYMGYGATIAWVQAAYLISEVLAARLLVLNPDQWPFGGKSKECALDRFITFPNAEIRFGETVPGSLPFVVGDWENLRHWGYDDELSSRYCPFGYVGPGYESLEAYRRSVMTRIYRPTSFANIQVSQQLQFLPDRYIAWHLRRGDKTSGPWMEDMPVSVERYAVATEAMLARLESPPTHLVVCTDSPDAIEEVHSAVPHIAGGMEVVVDSNEKRWDGYSALHRTGQISDVEDMIAEVITAQKNSEIMRRADGLIGCNSSYLFRVASMLGSDNQQVVSLSENKAYKKYYPL